MEVRAEKWTNRRQVSGSIPVHRVSRVRHELQVRLAKWMDVPLSVLAVMMLALLVISLAAPLSPRWQNRISAAQTAIWIVFALDFAVEFTLAPSKARYLKRNWITAISVMLPALGGLRILRAASLLRGISLVRILATLNRGTRAITRVTRRGQLGYVLAITVFITVTCAASVYYFERGEPGASITSVEDALWWAATIVTTINVSLETTTLEGHIIGLLLRVFALGVCGYLTALIAVYLIGKQPDNGADEPGQAAREIRALREEVAALRRALEEAIPAAASALSTADGSPDKPFLVRETRAVERDDSVRGPE